MINIGGVNVIPKDGFTIDRNKLEERDSGNLSTFNTRAERFEPYDLVTIQDIDEQFVVQSDNVIRLRDGLYEHDVSLIEAIATFDGFYPADRIFSSDPPKTLGEILDVYKSELSKYHNLEITFDAQADWANTPIRQKEFIGVNFGVIVADLFRTLDAKPRASFDDGEWEIYPDFYNERRNLITPNPVSDLLAQDNLDYATRVKTQIKNGVYESQEVRAFPSGTGTILPKSQQPQKIDSQLQYELDSSIVDITEAIVVNALFEIDLQAQAKFTWTIPSVDITKFIVPKPFWDGLPTPVNQLAVVSGGRHKKNTLFYDIGGRFVKNIFVAGSEVLNAFFSDDNRILQNAILRAAVEADLTIIDQNGTNQGKIADYDLISLGQRVKLKDDAFDNVQMRFKYIPQRSFDFVHHRQFLKNMNEFTQIHKQRDSKTEVERYKNTLKNLSNRMGNDIRQLSQVFTTTAPFDLGDYDVNDNVIVRVKNTFYNDYTLCEFIMAEGFGNIDGESSLWKEPSPFEILGKDISTNLIIEEFVEVSRVSKTVSTRLKSDAVKSVLSTIDSDIDSEPPVRAAVMQPITDTATLVSATGVYLPAFTGGGGNTTSFHFQIDDPISSGRAFKEGLNDDKRFGVDLVYTEPDTSARFGELDDFFIYLIPDVNFTDDGAYPLIPSADVNSIKDDSLTLTNIVDTINKDKNAKFAVTFQQHFITDDPNIIIGAAFAKYNRLFTDVTRPTLKIYRSAIPYSIFDNKIRPDDLLTTGGVSVDEDTRKLSITAVLPFGQPQLKYVAIAFDDEILLGFNDFGVNEEFFINFTDAAQREIINQLPTPSSFGSSSSFDSLSFALTNLSTTEGVTLEATLDGVTLTEVVAANDGDPLNIPAYTNLFTFTGLDPNRSYQLTYRALPLTGSDFVASTFGVFNASTTIIPTDVPIAVESFVTVSQGVIGPFYSITNTNDFTVNVFAKVDDFEYSLGVSLDANETKDIVAPLKGPQENVEAGVEYTIQFKFQTTEFLNNWFSEYTNPVTLFIGQLDDPTYDHSASSASFGALSFRWNNPNSSATQITVELHNTAAAFQSAQTLVETKTVNIGANAGTSVVFTNNIVVGTGYSTAAKLLETGFRLESDVVKSSPNLIAPPPPTAQPTLAVNKNELNATNFPTVSIDITNNDPDTATIFINRTGSPDANNNEFSISLPPSGQSGSTVERTYLQLFGENVGEGEFVQIFARAKTSSLNISSQAALTFTTPQKPPTANPTLNITSITQTEVTFTMTNNDSDTAILTYGVSTPLSNNASVPAGNTITRTLSNLTRGFDYLLQVQAQANLKSPSQIISEEFRTENALADVWELVGVQQVGGAALPFDETISGTPSPIPANCPIDEQEALGILNNAIPANTKQIGYVVRVTRLKTTPVLSSCPTYYFVAAGVNKHDVRARLITNIGNVTANWTVGNETGSIGLTPSYQTIKTQVPNGFIFAINVPTNVTFDNKDYTFVRWTVNGADRPLFQNQISGSVTSAIDLEAEYEEVGLI